MKVAQKRKELEAIQLSNLSNALGADMIEQESNMAKELHDLMVAEESFFRQKSKVQWLQEGDQNAILFFFQGNSFHPAFNSTIVALVPKCQKSK